MVYLTTFLRLIAASCRIDSLASGMSGACEGQDGDSVVQDWESGLSYRRLINVILIRGNAELDNLER